jgi:hypothetical protein
VCANSFLSHENYEKLFLHQIQYAQYDSTV